MSTGRSSADLPRLGSPRGGRVVVDAARAVADVRPLVALRTATLRGRSRRLASYGVGVIGLLTLLAGSVPALVPVDGYRTEVLSLLPSALVGVLVIAAVAAAASGGGRELLPREQAVAYPVSPTTDHLGALLLAPFNIAWLLQSWTLLGAAAYVAGPRPGLVLTQLMLLVWLACATALAQVVGWAVEWVRRGRRGLLGSRLALGVAGLAAGYLVADGRLVPLLQEAPTTHVVIAALQAAVGPTWFYLQVLAGLLVFTAAAVVAGAWLNHRVARRPARDELRAESSLHPARRAPRSDLLAVLRTDRAGLWRSVSLRRGLAVLAVLPGLVAVAGGLDWSMVTILPGLVASGGALLFGVNSWCLDGRGALWRDSLPVDPRLVFASRVLVLVEVLLAASAGTVALAALRAGLPTGRELAAVGCAAVVVVLQVVSASLRWSVRRPFAVDLRSARATPAPPLVMVGYSARLALSTTLVGILFSLLARVPWEWSVAVAVPLLLLSLWRLARVVDRWADPAVRSRVVVTVAS